ncbi:hypothetical protein ACP70R_001439 [Stipagrostis hirtigluma subsp. patula]
MGLRLAIMPRPNRVPDPRRPQARASPSHGGAPAVPDPRRPQSRASPSRDAARAVDAGAGWEDKEGGLGRQEPASASAWSTAALEP